MNIKKQYKEDYDGLINLIDETIGNPNEYLIMGKRGKYTLTSIKNIFKIEYGFYLKNNLLYDITSDKGVEEMYDDLGEYETDRIIKIYNRSQ